ncbi:hypothetical protein VDGD_10384 [Verticillium dahliae]|nr:hypothetical protein VDGD_10384 [Verticillium dahliae]
MPISSQKHQHYQSSSGAKMAKTSSANVKMTKLIDRARLIDRKGLVV